jgi:pSer/pThr/pTyr-binding forkhead associated (FHA) protein
MALYLIVAKGKQKGRPIKITNELFMIGTDPICQMRSPMAGVAERHCVLSQRDFKVFLRDLGSGEKTLVNGEALPPDTEWPLHAGDRLEIGPLEFMVQFGEAVLTQHDLEEWAVKCLRADEDKRPLVEQLELMQRHERAISASKAAEAIIERLNVQRGVVQGRLRIGLEKGVTVVRINDIYLVDEAELALIEKEIRENLTRPGLRVLLDMKDIRRCSTRAVQMLAELAAWLKTWGSSFALCRLRPELKEAMRGLLAPWDVKLFEDKPDALSARW